MPEVRVGRRGGVAGAPHIPERNAVSEMARAMRGPQAPLTRQPRRRMPLVLVVLGLFLKGVRLFARFAWWIIVLS